MKVCRSNTKQRRPTEVERLTKGWSVRRQRSPPKEEDKEYTQKFVWMGTTIPPNQTEDAQDMFKNRFDVRVRYLGTIVTLGGREDAVFSLHAQDTLKFAKARFQMGQDDIPRWWEDYVANNADVIPKADLERFLNKN